MSKELLEIVEKLRASKFIKEKTFEAYPGLSAFNFTRDAFFEGEWNAETIKARGLFIDTERGEVVARGYNKFFNIGEKPETQPNKILKTFKASIDNPIQVSLKENGYLGIVGVYRDTLFTASKSTPEGPFADHFRTILGDEAGKKLFNFLKKGHYCATFEVIDPINDPHIIEEPKQRVVLLDVFKRRIDEMLKLSPDEISKLAKDLGFEHSKKTLYTFTNDDDFKSWMDAFTTAEKNADVDYGFHKGNPVEGVVIEDCHLNMTKAKFPFYSHWKWARSTLDNWQRIQELDEGKSRTEKTKNFLNKVSQHHSPLVKEFGLWLISLDGNQKQKVIDGAKNIVDARKLFMDSKSDFSVTLKTAMRADPDSLMIGEIRQPAIEQKDSDLFGVEEVHDDSTNNKKKSPKIKIR